MDPSLRDVPQHMREFGLSLLAQAVADVLVFHPANKFAYPMAVMRAAHGAEIVIKARIAQEHPRFIFDTLPKPDKGAQDLLTFGRLLVSAKAVRYCELPGLLSAVTDIQMDRVEDFREFGNVRNMIQHFAVPEAAHDDAVVHFSFGIMEPLIQRFWSVSLIETVRKADSDLVAAGQLGRHLKRLGISSSSAVVTLIAEFDKMPPLKLF